MMNVDSPEVVLGLMLFVTVAIGYGVRVLLTSPRRLDDSRPVPASYGSSIFSGIFGGKSWLDFGPKVNVFIYLAGFMTMVSIMIKFKVEHYISPAQIMSDINHWLYSPRGSLADVPFFFLLLACYFMYLATRCVKQLTASHDLHYGEVPYQPGQSQNIIKDDRRFKIKNNWIK